MKRILPVILLLWALPVIAQPRIDSMFINEDSGRLSIHGSFGNNGSKPEVFIDSVQATVTNWSDTSCICIIPDSGKGSAGLVWIKALGMQSNFRIITFWSGMYIYYSSILSAPEEYWNELHFRFRLDIQSFSNNKTQQSIYFQLMHSSFLHCKYNRDQFHDTRGGYFNNDGDCIFPILDSKTKSDSSFLCSGILNITNRTFMLSVTSIGGLLIVSKDTYPDSNKLKTDTTYEKWPVSDFSGQGRLDSSFRFVNYDSTYKPSFGGSYRYILKGDSLLFPPHDFQASVNQAYLEPHIALSSYPNPAINMVTISYSSTIRSYVSLGIYDMAGRLIKQLVNIEQSAAAHEVYWDTQHTPNGCYLIKLNASGNNITKLIQVVK